MGKTEKNCGWYFVAMLSQCWVKYFATRLFYRFCGNRESKKKNTWKVESLHVPLLSKGKSIYARKSCWNGPPILYKVKCRKTLFASISTNLGGAINASIGDFFLLVQAKLSRASGESIKFFLQCCQYKSTNLTESIGFEVCLTWHLRY